MKKPMRILHFTTHNEECGIGKYQEQYLAALSSLDDIYNEIFPYSPNKTKVMSQSQLARVLSELYTAMKSFDALHIQHELSFFKHDELDQAISVAKSLGKKVIVTVHTAPAAQYQRPQRMGISLRSLITYAKAIKFAHMFSGRYINPLKKADLILVHNTATKIDLESHGIKSVNIQMITIPVPTITHDATSTEIKTALDVKPEDIVFASIGFISRMKGIDHAIKALMYLPDNYKLAVIGGIHPSGGQEQLLDELTDLIASKGLLDRVYITGYVDEDIRLNALIRECNVCVYPYDPVYYSYVSSAALNNAFANHIPAVAYPTKSFIEINSYDDTIDITKSANYYELARSLKLIDITKLTTTSMQYAKKHSYSKEAIQLLGIYSQLLR
jgi:glycosyltransferase involved in cell wall biosynthesis